jgi:NAD(P)-dependent dehydrogenase (short-subunit alcohol dehydrogenase family)
MGQSQLTETGEEIRTTGARVIDRFRLDGKVALITGASKNIGFETARAFAEAGATVIMNARSPELLEERAGSIRAESGGEVVTKVADVSYGDAASELSAFALDAFGRVDILMNNAYASGDTIGVEVLDIEDGAWESTLNTNIVAPFRLIKALAPSMIRSGSGSIINVLSGSGFLPTPGTLPYGVSKAGLWMLTRYLSQELAPEIRVNGVCPGFTVSDTGGTVDERVAQALLPLVPMGRPGLPEEVAGAAVYLASDAASFTTGTVVFVNGGRAW